MQTNLYQGEILYNLDATSIRMQLQSLLTLHLWSFYMHTIQKTLSVTMLYIFSLVTCFKNLFKSRILRSSPMQHIFCLHRCRGKTLVCKHICGCHPHLNTEQSSWWFHHSSHSVPQRLYSVHNLNRSTAHRLELRMKRRNATAGQKHQFSLISEVLLKKVSTNNWNPS